MKIQLGSIILKFTHRWLMFMGILAVLMLIFSFTPLPYWRYYHLGQDNDTTSYIPDYIILMGSNGMPDAEGLLKCYYTAQASRQFPEAKVIIALPIDSLVKCSDDLRIMLTELSVHGVDTCRVLFEKKGINTWQQALFIQPLITQLDSSKLMIVTNPEHLYRSLAVFRTFNYKRVGGLAAFSKTLDENVLIQKKGKERIVPASLALRYNFWNYLKLEITVLREYSAIIYYKCKGWI